MDWIEPARREDCRDLQPFPWSIVALLLGSLMILSATIGNALVILSYKRDRLLRDAHNLYVLHLAISDFILGSFSMPLYLVYTVMKWTWPFGKLLCKIYLAEDFTMLCMSSLCVILIAWDRLAIVTLGVRYKNVETSRRAYIKLTACWTISILLYTPEAFYWEVVVGEYPLLPGCECFKDFQETPGFIFFTSAATVGVPLLSLGIVNWMLYVTLKKRNTATLVLRGPQEEPQKSSSSIESQFSSLPTSLHPTISTTFSEEILMYEDNDPNSSSVVPQDHNTENIAINPNRNNDPKPSSVVPRDHNTEEISINLNRNNDPKPSSVVPRDHNTEEISINLNRNNDPKSSSVVPRDHNTEEIPINRNHNKDPKPSSVVPRDSNKEEITSIVDRNNEPKASSVLLQDPNKEEITTIVDHNNEPNTSSFASQDPKMIRKSSNWPKYVRRLTLIVRKRKSYLVKRRHIRDDKHFKPRVSIAVDRTDHIRKRDRRFTLILIFLVLVMCLSMVPFSVISAIYAICKNCQKRALYEICVWMFWLKSCMNPFLYAFNSPRFRKNMIDLLPCIRKKRK